MLKLLKVMLAVNLLILYNVNAGEYFTSDEGNVFYVNNDIQSTWYEALAECASRNMSLIAPATEKKQLEIKKIMTASKVLYAWTAGQEVNNLNFMWITLAQNISYTNWYANEPIRDGDQTQCIGLYTTDGVWRMYRCDNTRNAICETPKEHSCPSLEQVQNKSKNNLVKTDESVRANSNSVLIFNNDDMVNRLMLANKTLELKIQENEMLTQNHQNEIQLLKEQHIMALNLIKSTCELWVNHISKNYNLIINAQGKLN